MVQSEDSEMEDSAQIEELQGHVQEQRAQIEALQGVVENLNNQIQQLVQSLQAQQAQSQPEPRPPEPIVVPPVPPVAPISPALLPTNPLNSGLARELSKKVYEFPETQRLVGPENFELWRQGLNIMFRALDLPNFTSNPSTLSGQSDQTMALILMLLRNSIGPGPQAAIAWQTSPVEAYTLLEQRYSHSAEIQRDTLYRDFHSIGFSSYTGSLAEFNAKFSNLVSRLALTGAHIEPIDQVNQYLRALEKSFPSWAERQRSTLRTMRALGQGTANLDLNFLMADLIEEQQVVMEEVVVNDEPALGKTKVGG